MTIRPAVPFFGGLSRVNSEVTPDAHLSRFLTGFVPSPFVSTIIIIDIVYSPPTKEEVHIFARVCLSVCLSVCLLARLLKNACMDLDEMLRVDICRDMDELINF